MGRLVLRAVGLLVVVGACATAPKPALAPTDGSLVGLVRELGSGDPVAMVHVEVHAGPGLEALRDATTDDRGLYAINELAPGRYRVRAEFAGAIVEVLDVPVVAGRVVPLDLPFELGRVEPLIINYGDARDGAIVRYGLRRGAVGRGLIEGTVSDAGTRERVAGAVVSAIARDTNDTTQELADDHGRFWFRDLVPGTYTVSATYAMSGHGQIEVQRNGVEVTAGEAVVVPLWIELAE